MFPHKYKLSIVKKRFKHLIERGGSIVEIFLRQTRAAVSPRKDFANTDSCRRVNRLQKICKSKSSPITTSGDWELKSFVPISRIITLGGGWWAIRIHNSRANRGTVSPPMPCKWHSRGMSSIKIYSGREIEFALQIRVKPLNKRMTSNKYTWERRSHGTKGGNRKQVVKFRPLIISPKGAKL